ncbi:ABC transporter ATP-binding protein [Streptococcus halichoeri]|uniref:ABC transporter ATP-binding protein n=1 Tax=Streptococcus halichoeri TaxID=254785 RepID=UPI00135881A3|nr:ABC transporter ATP-binding protein [Streptococcus halichoeri]
MTAIRITNLHKAFKNKVILDQVSLELEENKIYGFVGPNGAGKTTTIKMILGLLRSDAGTIKIFGQDVAFGHTKANQNIGYLPDLPEFYDYMTAAEYLELCASLATKGQALDVDTLLQAVGLNHNTAKIGTFSRGMKQRLGLAQALIHDPKIVICDEPTSALDPKGRQDILDILASLGGRKTVLFSSHILSDVEKICDEVLVLTKQGIYNLKQLKEAKDQTAKPDHIRVLLTLTSEQAQQLTKVIPLSKKGNHYQAKLLVDQTGQAKNVLNELYQTLLQLNIFPTYLEVRDQRLEDFYLEVIA